MQQINEYKSDYLEKANNDIQHYFEKHNPPIYFYYCFFGELVKVFRTEFLIPDKNYDAEYDDASNLIPNNNDFSYRDQIDYFLAVNGGTSGWFYAFNVACTQCDLKEMLNYYKNLDWVRSDIFDGVITDNMIEILFNSSIKPNYYHF